MRNRAVDTSRDLKPVNPLRLGDFNDTPGFCKLSEVFDTKLSEAVAADGCQFLRWGTNDNPMSSLEGRLGKFEAAFFVYRCNANECPATRSIILWSINFSRWRFCL